MPAGSATVIEVGDVTFIKQNDPVDEYGRALYAVARSDYFEPSLISSRPTIS